MNSSHEFFAKAAVMAQAVAGNGRSGDEILCSVLTRDYWRVSCGLSNALKVMRLLHASVAALHAMLEAYCALPRGSYIQEHFMDHEDPLVLDWREEHIGHLKPVTGAGRDVFDNTNVVNQVFVEQLRGNRIARTSMKLLANVPEHTKEGDEIWIIYGCSTPFVLRRTDRGYLMVGEYFVNGIMNGQALRRCMGKEGDASLV